MHEYDCGYTVSYPAGPRTTPTVDGDRVYTLGAEGNLLCLNADSGKVLWQKDFKRSTVSRRRSGALPPTLSCAEGI